MGDDADRRLAEILMSIVNMHDIYGWLNLLILWDVSMHA